MQNTAATTQQKKEAVFILLGQSNAVGHALPMRKDDVIATPLKNVYGLSREKNQSFDTSCLQWSGYTSFGMNLAEEQDNTYSLANCLAQAWQDHIDNGNKNRLPNLYIVQIAIGAQGVTEGYMWHPEKKQCLVAGKLGEVDIALFPFCKHIFTLLDESFAAMGKEYEIIGIHWRGGENDITASKAYLLENLENIYTEIFGAFNAILNSPPIILHKIVAYDRANDLDETGKYAENIGVINDIFGRLKNKFSNVSIFDVRNFPKYVSNVRGNGIFIEDAVHYTEEVNRWIANRILQEQFT